MAKRSNVYKPRRKKNSSQVVKNNDQGTDIVLLDDQHSQQTPEFPLVAFLWPAKEHTSSWAVLPLILLIVGLFQWALGLWDYSGFGKPPMHGDFEAQRHWMEITNHLPISQWYFYDLQYWGLDYPPLTAYHSFLLGKIGSLFDPAWFRLDVSRGCEDNLLKVYMRGTVMVSSYLVYVSSVVMFLRQYKQVQRGAATSSYIAMVAMLLQPSTILIDNGHFQYNTVMLGFVIAALSSIFAGRLLWSCVFFVAALGYKQMALYYAPIFFANLLGSSLTPKYRVGRLLAIATVTALSFSLLFLPLIAGTAYDVHRDVPQPQKSATSPLLSYLPNGLLSNHTVHQILLQFSQVISRMFPFSRGLFEDKVANFWCALNTVYKVRKLEQLISLPRLSLYATLMAMLPSFLLTCADPRAALLPYALAASAWSFFLFSFQVHEKSVLLPLMPMTLLLGSSEGLRKECRAWVGWANLAGAWTLYPLLSRDNLRTPYFIFTLLWAYLLGLPPTSSNVYAKTQDTRQQDEESRAGRCRHRFQDHVSTSTTILHGSFYFAMILWHIGEAFVKPPADKPDLWTVLNACLGAVIFSICYLWCSWKLILESGILNDYFNYRGNETQKAKTQRIHARRAKKTLKE